MSCPFGNRQPTRAKSKF